MKKVYFIFSLSFFLLLFITSSLTVIIPDKEYSESENTVLAQKPEISFESIKNGDFQNGLGEYLSDQFPFRELMISINTATNKLLGAGDINGAYIGDEGYYFEVDKNEYIDYTIFEKNLNAINMFAEKYADIDVKVILAPTASDLYAEYLPSNCEIYDADELFEMAEKTLNDGIYVNTRDILNENKNDYIYYKTDHHWTSKGAYYAYTKYCDSIGSTPKSFEEFGFKIVSSDFLGSLHSKILDPFSAKDEIMIAENSSVKSVTVNGSSIDMYDFSKLEKKDKYLVFFGDNYGKTIIKTNCENGKTLLVVKDSFANSFVPLLTDEYETIIMIDQRYSDTRFSNLIKENQVTDVLFLYEVTNLSIQNKLAFACKY